MLVIFCMSSVKGIGGVSTPTSVVANVRALIQKYYHIAPKLPKSLRLKPEPYNLLLSKTCN